MTFKGGKKGNPERKAIQKAPMDKRSGWPLDREWKRHCFQMLNTPRKKTGWKEIPSILSVWLTRQWFRLRMKEFVLTKVTGNSHRAAEPENPCICSPLSLILLSRLPTALGEDVSQNLHMIPQGNTFLFLKHFSLPMIFKMDVIKKQRCK